MTDDAKRGDGSEGASGAVIRFPFSRVAPARSDALSEPPAYGELARSIGLPIEQTTGHWCSRKGGQFYYFNSLQR